MASDLRVVGFAIVSADGMIADAAGQMPASIIQPADQHYFEQALDAADVIVHGRHSQEQQANAPLRRRLILTRNIAALEPDEDNPKALRWNPQSATLEAACAALHVQRGTVAIIGGTEPFGLFLPRYDEFHLSRTERALIPSGRPVFPGIPPHTPDELLQRAGMRPGPPQQLDAEAGLTLTVWRR